MDQQTLRQWESRCIQEEQPFCQAACPLHVDGRAFLGQLSRCEVDAARKTLERSLPLPGVLGRICEAPCQAACKRAEAGDALAIGALERFAIAHGKPGPRPLRLPGKKGRALLLGRGLATLTCAWDLLKKGWGVTLHTLGQPLGEGLLHLPAPLLPPEALAGELAALRALGLVLDETPGQGDAVLAAALDELRGGMQADGPRAVFLEHGFSPQTDAAYPPRQAVDPVTLAAPGQDAAPGLASSGVFLGGWPDEAGRARFIDAAADGRRAASSLDRQLSGASLTAAREKEGAVQTRLFTSLKGVEPLARIVPAGRTDAGADYAGDEARAEAARCLNCQCLECVRVCAYLEKHKAHPKVYARQIYNNAAIVKGQHLANKLVNSCSLCGLCERVCPEGFSMAELCLTARQDMTARAVMPQSAHEFALEDMAAANGPDFALTRPDPTNARPAQVFFPGCQLCASHPHHVASAYAHLRRHLPGGVGLMLRCCGIPAHWAGQEDSFRQAAADFAAQWEQLGRPRVIAACSGCLSVFRLPQFLAAAPGLEAISLWEALAQTPLPRLAPAEGQPAGNGPQPYRPAGPLALHDPCTARDDAPFRASARALAARLDVGVAELPLSGELTECCGFGGLMAQVDAPLARTVAQRRAAESPLDYLACCAMCRDRLAAAGKRCLHLLDLLFPCPEADPAARPGPGYSQRQEARAALKSSLLREVWGEDDGASARAEPTPLAISPELAARLEERRILVSDLRRTIDEALAAKRCLRDADSDRLLASARPRRVTFWAEFAPDAAAQGGLRLLNAWSHRMIVPGAGGVQEAPQATGEVVNRVDQTYLPASGAWSCAACGQALKPSPVVASYLGSVFTISLLSCPACGQTLVPEDLALGRMAEVEQLLEDK